MVALVWTDITANYLTSSRSQLNSKLDSVTTNTQRQAQNIPSRSPVEVVSYNRVIRYHLVYAIVAVLFMAVYLVVLLVALGMCITGKSTLHLLNSLLNQTCVGRAVVSERYKNGGDMGMQARGMKTGDWIREYGSEDIDIVKERKRGQRWKDFQRQGVAQEYQPVDGKAYGQSASVVER